MRKEDEQAPRFVFYSIFETLRGRHGGHELVYMICSKGSELAGWPCQLSDQQLRGNFGKLTFGELTDCGLCDRPLSPWPPGVVVVSVVTSASAASSVDPIPAYRRILKYLEISGCFFPVTPQFSDRRCDVRACQIPTYFQHTAIDIES